MANKKDKKPGCCSPGGTCYGFPSLMCSICCTVFSIWAVVILFTLGSLLSYHGVSLGKIKKEDIGKDRTHVFIAGAIYAAFAIGCGARWIYLMRVKKTNPYHPGLL